MINKLEKEHLNCNIFSVYDYNGMTMQELLSQFFTKINDCIDLSNKSIDLCEWLVNQGLVEEVAKKLVSWLEDGTLNEIINDSIFKGIEFYPILSHEVGVTQVKYPYGDIRRFGGVGDGTTDNTLAFQNCIISLGGAWTNNQSTMYIPCGAWKYSKPIVVDRNNFTIKGEGIEQTILLPQNCKGIEVQGSVSNTRYGVVIKDFAINGGTVGFDGSYLGLNCFVSNISIHSTQGVGYYAQSAFDHVIENVICRECGKLGFHIDQLETTDTSTYAEMSYITFNNCVAVSCNNKGTQWKLSGNNLFLNNCKANEGNLGIEFVGSVWTCRISNFYMDGIDEQSVMFKVNSASARNITFENTYGWNIGYVIQATSARSIIGRNLDVNPGTWAYKVLKIDEGFGGVIDLDSKGYVIEDNRTSKIPTIFFGAFAEHSGCKLWKQEIEIDMYQGGSEYTYSFNEWHNQGIQNVFVTPINDVSYVARDGLMSGQLMTPTIYAESNKYGYYHVTIKCPHIVAQAKKVKLQVLLVVHTILPYQ